MNQLNANLVLVNHRLESLAEQMGRTVDSAVLEGYRKGFRDGDLVESTRSKWRQGGWGAIIGFGPQDKAANIAINCAYLAISDWHEYYAELNRLVGKKEEK